LACVICRPARSSWQGKPKEIVMNSHVQRAIVELGAFSIVVPVVWAAAALVGFVVLANWPELFAAPTTAPTIVQASSASAGPATQPSPLLNSQAPHEHAAPSPPNPESWSFADR